MTDTNPYAAPGPSVDADVPVFPAARFRRLGATPQQLATLGDTWDGMSVDARCEFVAAVAVMPDPDLVTVLHGSGLRLP